MKKILMWGGLALLIGTGIFFWIQKKNKQGGETETRIVSVKEGPIEESVESTGEVAPLNRVEIKPPIQGRIEKLLVDEGEKVKAGQVLAWMSSSDRAAIMDAARAKGPEEYKKWQDTYKPTPLVAPLSGVVILRNAVVGQTVDLSTVLYALSDKLIVVAHVDEVDIGRVKMGMPARITLDSFPKDPIQGKVVSILYEGKNVSNVITYGVKLEPINVPPFFRSQMTANISLILNHKDNVLSVPIVAVSELPSGEKRVMVPGEKGKPVAKIVTTGIEDKDSIEIVSGLAAGDSVVIAHKRYVPQRGAVNSPLVMGGNRSGQSGSGGNQSGGGGNRQR